MDTHSIDIGEKDIDIYVGYLKVLHIRQASSGSIISLFLYPESGGIIVDSLLKKEDIGCTHKVLVEKQ